MPVRKYNLATKLFPDGNKIEKQKLSQVSEFEAILMKSCGYIKSGILNRFDSSKILTKIQKLSKYRDLLPICLGRRNQQDFAYQLHHFVIAIKA